MQNKIKPACLRVAVITGHDRLGAEKQIQQAMPSADAVELRLDYWKILNLEELADLRRRITLPVIFTLRKQSQGGGCAMPETQRLALLHQLAALSPEYMDVEYDVPGDWLSAFRCQYPSVQLIGSYHDFTATPDDLTQLLPMVANPLFDIVKIATFAHTICDTLRLLIFLRAVSERQRVIGMAMGEYGQITRILAPIAGSLFTYGCLNTESASAPGQLTLAELTDIYRVHLLNRDTAIYALLGDPIAQSPGHLVHNRAFALLKENAVYVKCRVAAGELTQAMSLLRKLPFFGMSVTIPHKETIVPFLDKLIAEAADMRIVNTIKREQDRYEGFNTDAAGAADVLETIAPLINQRCLILGAGGSAKAIAHILLTKGNAVTLCNRTLSRALDFTQLFGGKAIDFATLFSLQEFPYDIVINTLPATAYAQQCADWKIPRVTHGIAMDIVLKPLETPFIQSAKTAGWRCLTGDALFNAQALRQLKIWFNLQDIPYNLFRPICHARQIGHD